MLTGFGWKSIDSVPFVWHNGDMKGNKNANDILRALARNERAERLDAMRDGRIRRATSIPSGKTYSRKSKYGKSLD